MSLLHSLTTSRLAFSSIYSVFDDRFGRSLQVRHLEFDKKTVFFLILSDFRELSSCGPCRPCFHVTYAYIQIGEINFEIFFFT